MAKLRGLKGVSIASASEIDLGTPLGDYFLITGTTTINTIKFSRVGTVITKFEGVLTLTPSASLVLITSANIVTSAGDICFWRSEEDGTWTMINYVRKDGTSLINNTIDSNAVAYAIALG